MFQGLSNPATITLACVGMIVLSLVVIEGLFYIMTRAGW
jgi:hypothetical protein